MGGLTGAAGGIPALRVAHLIESDGPGGAERVVADIATHLQAAGAFNVVVLPAEGEGWLARQLAGSSVAVEHFRLDAPVSPGCARSLAALFRRYRIDVAHSHEFSMAVYGSWAARRAGIPHVITMHGSQYYAARLRRRLAMRAAVACSGRTVAVSNALADRMSEDLRMSRARIGTIPNGVRHVISERSSVRDELRLGPADRLVVAVGNLYPVKGHRHLVDALGLLAARHASLHVAICGRGDLEAALAAQARALGIAAKVHLLGLRSDVAGVLAAGDLFVHPSVSEGLPLALLEAMFASRPIVASDVGEIRAALAGGEAGMLVEPGSPAAIASAIDRLLSDPHLARTLAERASRRAHDEYDVSRMVRRYVAAYAELLDRRAHRCAARSEAHVA
ncbi:MAG TPA: glycosyltransferase [Vicinamibacterales bacterium]|nr:glycosyltransferase [Vicinamibacterales bacterium]